MVYGFERMNIVAKLIDAPLDWQKVRIMVDGPFVDLRPIWAQAKILLATRDFIVLAAYDHDEIPVGYIIHSLSNKETSVGLSKTVSEQSKEEIETALKAELEKMLEAQKK